ncbi:hypothetical protein ABZ733_24665 [Streptomyces longwoodensis]|uniref:hypothetical protein n=1 Tax=Streptomyces longwoodensis TaxID=68231 RepID=UPI0033C90E7C
MSAAAEVLRCELQRPGGFHRERARGIAERLTEVTLGAAQRSALDVWGTVYGVASGILHGGAAGPGEAVRVYTDILGGARELLVPLADRAARVLELSALQQPGAAEAAELARWADPRATDYFFRCGPATAWLEVLQEHAPHLLMPDGAVGGRWSAAPFLHHVAQQDPTTARAWLAAPADDDPTTSRAQQVAGAGRLALNALLTLAVRHRDVIDAGQMRAVLSDPDVRDGRSAAVGTTLRLAAWWARAIPRTERTREWILLVEELLASAIEDEHASHQMLRAGAERMAAAEAQAAFTLANGGNLAEFAAVFTAALTHEMDIRELIAEEASARLSGREVVVLLRELACTAYPAGRAAAAHANIRMIRAALAGLLARDTELLPAASRPLVYGADLDQVKANEPAAYGGPRLARTVLDLAAADADAGVHLAERTRRFTRVAAVDGRLHDRLLAAHLAARPPANCAASADGLDGQEWWDQAVVLVVRLVADEPAPETARLVDLVLRACPPERAAQLEMDVRAALGTPPPPVLLEEVLPADAEQADGNAEPLGGWLRVWDWSPVLPARLLVGWVPVLDAVRRLKPAGPSDPRTASVPELVKATLLDAEDLAKVAAARGPEAAAAALAAAEDVGADGYAMVLNRLVTAAPATWTANVPAVMAALQLPELGAYYLAATAAVADRPGALSDGALVAAVTAVLDVHRRLDETTPATGATAAADRSAAEYFADQALCELMTAVWRTDTTLPGDQKKTILARLHALAAPPRRRAGPAHARFGRPGRANVALRNSNPSARALGCLLEYVVHQARTPGEIPADVLQVVSGALTAHGDQDAVATAVGMRLPARMPSISSRRDQTGGRSALTALVHWVQAGG